MRLRGVLPMPQGARQPVRVRFRGQHEGRAVGCAAAHRRLRRASRQPKARGYDSLTGFIMERAFPKGVLSARRLEVADERREERGESASVRHAQARAKNSTVMV